MGSGYLRPDQFLDHLTVIIIIGDLYKIDIMIMIIMIMPKTVIILGDLHRGDRQLSRHRKSR